MAISMEIEDTFTQGKVKNMEINKFNKVLSLVFSFVLLITIFSPTAIEGNDVPKIFKEFKLDVKISDAAMASFLGEKSEDSSGRALSGVGDVNGDGLIDFLIGVSDSEMDQESSGKTYLFFGKRSGWGMDLNLSQADASFVGERAYDLSGISVAGTGDVNGDGLDDLLIGAPRNDEGTLNAGQTYLILGKNSGWELGMNLSGSNASFIGENVNDFSGVSIAGPGDVNGDGFNDILIAATGNDDGGGQAGKVYLIFGRAKGLKMDMNLSDADVSFIGEGVGNDAGSSVAGAGDLNGDGYADFLIGAPDNSESGIQCGKTYLILGKTVGWSKDTDLSNADGSFLGEGSQDSSGQEVAGAGDVNADGYDDILIGSPEYDSGNGAGQVYLIKGKATGWTNGIDLSNSDASFKGERGSDKAGMSISGVGDVNADGYDDFMIGAPGNDEGGQQSGQAYLILGKKTGWSMDRSLSTADASFIGEDDDDVVGCFIAGVGDVIGDGYDDFLIGAYGNDEGGAYTGQTYLIGLSKNTEPSYLYSIRSYRDTNYSIPATRFDNNDIIYIELIGEDGNISHEDATTVLVTSAQNVSYFETVVLRETDIGTGTFRGWYKVSPILTYLDTISISSVKEPTKFWNIMMDYPYRPSSITTIGIYSSPTGTSIVDKLDLGQIGYFKCFGVDSNPFTVDKAFVNLSSDKNQGYRSMMVLVETGQSTGIYAGEFVVPDSLEFFENITVTSIETPTRIARFMIHTPVKIRAKGPYLESDEDAEYRSEYYNFGYNNATFNAVTNADWLTWDPERKEIYGKPNNTHVGNDLWRINVTASDSNGNHHSLDYILIIKNRDPKILTEPMTEWTLYEDYYLDVDSDDDGQGQISWYLNTDAHFLRIKKETGEVQGTPTEEEDGDYFVNVQVQDGNGGSDNLIFNLTVHGRNDRPQIITNDITQVEQDTPFRRDYDVFDPDEGDTHNWTLRTDADWLSMENETGVLVGTPDGYDVGDWLVNITVTDQGGLSDHHEFTLRVLDVKDKPRFDDVPVDAEIMHGTDYCFDVNASDADRNDRVIYSVMTEPTSTMSIDPNTGDLRWKANYRSMPSTSKGMKVTLTASDGKLFTTYDFYIKVTPTQSPICELVSPANGVRTKSTFTLLEWSGTDPENEPLKYMLYVADTESYVSAKRAEDLVSTDITDNYYNMTGLTQGKTYYWTVIPDDGCTYGKCTKGIFSFRVNNNPVLKSVVDQTAQTGKEFLVKVTATDGDQDDKLTYSIVNGPTGMIIRSETGMVVWTPKENQVGSHTIRVRVTDGYEESELSFRLEVEKGEGDSLGLIIGIVVGIIVLIIVCFLLYTFFIKGKGEGTEKKEEIDKEDNKMLEEMEEKKREKEWEEAHTKKTDNLVISDVPLSATEAHAHDHDNRPKSYEELYGQPAPDRDEELTAKELKDELEKLTDELKESSMED